MVIRMNRPGSSDKMPVAGDVAIQTAAGFLYGAVAYGVYHGGHAAYRVVEGAFGDAETGTIGVDVLHTGLGGGIATMGVMVLKVLGAAQEVMHQHFSGDKPTPPNRV